MNFVFDPVMPHSQERPRSLESGASWRQAGSWWTSPSTLRGEGMVPGGRRWGVCMDLLIFIFTTSRISQIRS